MNDLKLSSLNKNIFNGKAYKHLKVTILLIYAMFMLVYISRDNIHKLDNFYIELFAGTAPNLIPSFLFTLIGIFYAVPRLFKTTKVMGDFKFIWLINVINISIFALIEYLHVIFKLGVWDSNDMVASLIGIVAATIIYFKFRKCFIEESL